MINMKSFRFPKFEFHVQIELTEGFAYVKYS